MGLSKRGRARLGCNNVRRQQCVGKHPQCRRVAKRLSQQPSGHPLQALCEQPSFAIMRACHVKW
jgi:hypothetical protein